VNEALCVTGAGVTEVDDEFPHVTLAEMLDELHIDAPDDAAMMYC